MIVEIFFFTRGIMRRGWKKKVIKTPWITAWRWHAYGGTSVCLCICICTYFCIRLRIARLSWCDDVIIRNECILNINISYFYCIGRTVVKAYGIIWIRYYIMYSPISVILVWKKYFVCCISQLLNSLISLTRHNKYLSPINKS